MELYLEDPNRRHLALDFTTKGRPTMIYNDSDVTNQCQVDRERNLAITQGEFPST